MRALLLAALLAAPAAAREVGGAFSFEAPKGWSERDDWIALVPTYSAFDRDRALSVTLYPAGNPLFKGAKAYLSHRSAARGGGKKPRRLEGLKTAAGEAQLWTQDYGTSRSGVHGEQTAPTPSRELYAVLDKGGSFWVLSIKAPVAGFPESEKAFRAAAATFKILAR